jgi:arsenical pump membrane protein
VGRQRLVISGQRLGLAIFALGAPSCVLAAALDPGAARSAASQDWPAFVLVAGLLLVGVVASEAGIFESAGEKLSRLGVRESTRFICAAALIGVVSALLNLDTAAAFLTPVLVHMVRKRGAPEAPVLYGCLLLTNAGSLLLPGSNLTNLIVAGHLRFSGAGFAWRMAPVWVVSLVVTGLVIALAHRRELRQVPAQALPTPAPTTPAHTSPARTPPAHTPRARPGSSVLVAGGAVIATAIFVVALHNAAIPVVAIGVVAAAIGLYRRRLDLAGLAAAVDLPILTGLLGIAIALGTLGRTWDLPTQVLGHLDSFATAGFAAVASVFLNNLPAASLLAARVPPHPYSLLVGLDLGPNLFVTGSLSALLWFRAARAAGAEPSVRHTALLGIVAAPLAIVSAVGVLTATSLH